MQGGHGGLGRAHGQDPTLGPRDCAGDHGREARGGARAGWGPPAPLAVALSSSLGPLLETEAEGRVQGRWAGRQQVGTHVPQTSWPSHTLACPPLRPLGYDAPVLSQTWHCWASEGGARPRPGASQTPRSPVLAACSPAAVLSLPTGVLEQLRSMVEDSEDMAPGLQPV